MTEWISVKEAADMLGYDPDYFRKTFCAHPVNGLAVMIMVMPGAKYARYRVLRHDVIQLMQASKKTG